MAEVCVKQIIRQQRLVNGARVGVLGFTFKEDVPDLRKTRVIDVVRELEEYGVTALVHDPLADAAEAQREYGIVFQPLEALVELDAVILAVPHTAFATSGVLGFSGLRARFANPAGALLLDVKGHFDAACARREGFTYWRL